MQGRNQSCKLMRVLTNGASVLPLVLLVRSGITKTSAELSKVAAFAKQQGLTEEKIFAQLELKYPQASGGRGGGGVTPGAEAKRAAAMANPTAASNRMGRSQSSSERRRRDRASKFGGGGGGVQVPASESHERASKFSGGGAGGGLAPPAGAYPPPSPAAQEQDPNDVLLVSAKKKDRAQQRWKKAGVLTKVAVRFKSSPQGINGKDLLARVFGGASTGGKLAGGAGADGNGGGGGDDGDGDGENVGWYVQLEETTEGPVPEKQLKAWYRLGFIKDDSMVWFEGIEGGAWASVGNSCGWAIQWERVTDPATGHDYYTSATGVTTWEKPVDGFIRSAVQ